MTDPTPARSRTRADLVFDAFYSGAIGGSVVALFFLLADGLLREPLFAPSLMGSVLFLGVPAEAVDGVRLDMVAYYSMVHFGIFAALGAAVTMAVHEVELHARHPVLVLLGLFCVLEAGFAAAATLLMPGVIAVLGAAEVAVANLLAAGGMGIFLLASHRPDVWERLKHAAHLA